MTPLLSLLALSAANPVILASAHGSEQNGKYVIELRGESAIGSDQVSGRINGGLLTIYVAGGKVRSDNRGWGRGGQRISAHRHVGKVELEVPLPGGSCAGGVKFAAGGEGVVLATVNCPTLSTSAASASEIGKQVQAKQVQPPPPSIPLPKIKPAAEILVPSPPVAAPSDQDGDALLAAVALVRPASAVVTEPPAAQKAPAKAAAVEPVVEKTIKKVEEKVKVETKVEGATPAATQVSLWGAALKALMPVLALGVLGIFALRFAKKRRGIGRHVSILETTSLGPKRALIVAKIGGETLLLGSSEAGITLIQVRPNAIEEDTETRGTSFDDIDSSTKWHDVLPAEFTPKAANDDDGGQAKMLSRLFSKRRKDIPTAWPFANVLDASLLEESIEDRELRDKLSMGMEARVP
jgi:flagellar biogenesis protein FliO